MSKRSKKDQVLTNERIGFEWDVTPNYFNKNNDDSDDSDEVSLNKFLSYVIISRTIQLHFCVCDLRDLA